MKKYLLLLILFIFSSDIWAQATFKAGWTTYPTGWLTRQYTYNISVKDSIRLYMEDSTNIFASPDSLVVMIVNDYFLQKYTTKTIDYFNAHRQLMKSEDYTGENLQAVNEYRYDNKNRVVYHLEENKETGKSYRKTYDYTSDKKTGDNTMLESSFLDGRIEFYTKTYYNKHGEKYKEMRLNDNNKDVVHVENFTYGENGRLKERTVYFPEWKVTKTFPEPKGSLPLKCFNTFPIGPTEKVNLNNRVYFMRKLIQKNITLLNDKDCPDFEYLFTNKANCSITLFPTKVNHGRKVIFSYKDKLN